MDVDPVPRPSLLTSAGHSDRRGGPRTGIRIGDAERERAAQSLGEHLRAGRLQVVEYDERLADVFGARTADDLTPLFTDLPGGSPLTPPMPAPQRGRGGRRGEDVPPMQRRGLGAIALPLRYAVVLALIVGVIVWTAFVAFPPLFLIPLLWFGFGRRFGHRHHGYARNGSRRYRY